MSIDKSKNKSIVHHGLQDFTNLIQREYMSADILKRSLREQAVGDWIELSVSEIALLRKSQIQATSETEAELNHDTRRVHAAIGIENALRARQYLLGNEAVTDFHIEFIPGHPYHQETQTVHRIQLDAFEKLLGSAFNKEITYDEVTGVYSPSTADTGREIVRSTISIAPGDGPNIVRFADADKHAVLTCAVGQQALSLIAGV